MWSTTSTFDVSGLTAAAIWEHAYADASAWPQWNGALAAATLDGPFAVGTRARVRFRTGLRLRFVLTEVDPGRSFTDASRLLWARMSHRHLLEDIPTGVRLTNTICIDGPMAGAWALFLGPQARRGLPGWQRQAAAVARIG